MNDGLGQNPTQTWPVPRFMGKTRKAWAIFDGSASALTVKDVWPADLLTLAGAAGFSGVWSVNQSILPPSANMNTIVRCTVSGGGNGYNCQARATYASNQLTLETYANSATPASVGVPVYVEFWA